jgi:hypothetical protein
MREETEGNQNSLSQYSQCLGWDLSQGTREYKAGVITTSAPRSLLWLYNDVEEECTAKNGRVQVSRLHLYPMAAKVKHAAYRRFIYCMYKPILTGMRWRETGESCTVGSFIICTHHKLLLGTSNQGEWGGWGMWHAMGEGEKSVQGFGGKPEGKRPLGRRRHR